MKILQYAEAIQYDGTNGAAVAAAVGGDFAVTSDDGQELHFESCGNISDGSWLVPVPLNGWIRYADGCVQEVLTAEQFDARWMVAPE